MVRLEMQKVYLGYNHKLVLKDIDLRVAPGEIAGLIGPNGSGKSTIIKALSRVIPPHSGKIFINDNSVRQLLNLRHIILSELGFTPSNLNTFTRVNIGRYPS